MGYTERTRSAVDTFELIGEILFCRIPGAIIASLGLAQIGVNFANVLLRYQFHNALVWAEEFLALSLVWVVFLGVSIVTWKWEHLSVDLFSNTLSPRMKSAFNVVVGCGIILACSVISISAFNVVKIMMMLDTKSIVMKYPMYLAHLPVLIGSALQIAAVLWRFGLAIAGRPLVEPAVSPAYLFKSDP